MTEHEQITLDEVRTKLAPFLENHKATAVIFDEEADRYWLSKPWGDDSIDIGIDPNDQGALDRLNSLRLPERYSAIYHETTQRLEVIYTVFKPFAGEDIRTRTFDFHHNGHSFKCHFGASSDELLQLARHTRIKEGYGQTNYRNLSNYNTFMILKEDPGSLPELEESYKDAAPISFWIEPIVWNDDDVLDLVHHLNFYMSYFDNGTPTVLIHTPADESRSFKAEDRFPFGQFPTNIKSNNVDRNLLHFWQAARSGDPARRFLYNYQILEYASHTMVEEDISKSITKMLLAPDAIFRASALSAQIIETLGSSKMQDSQKVEALIRRFVDPERVWIAIEKNKDFFCKSTEFEGGFSVGHLVQAKWDLSDFKTNWPGPVASSLRNMRNALSHGKEARMSAVITPTARNLRMLQPWVALIASATREIMVYRNGD